MLQQHNKKEHTQQEEGQQERLQYVMNQFHSKNNKKEMLLLFVNKNKKLLECFQKEIDH